MAEPLSRIRYLRTAASMAFDALREGRLPLLPVAGSSTFVTFGPRWPMARAPLVSPPRAPRPRESRPPRRPSSSPAAPH